ncbi:YfhO family protein [Marinifilum flexuosum]|uniref:YfhO family protein n=1 Tax=Marinifilum flexuosum TaxID=1117708 RepID=UPI002494C659|nr:YfhO family protein [Marinifilum flexuosum]
MSFKSIFKSALPHLVSILVFLIVAFMYFQPAMEGKQYKKGDSIHAWGAKKEIIDFREKTGEDALWTNSMFGGMPSYQINVDYQAKDMYTFKKMMELYTPDPVKYIILYMLGFYILLISLRVNPWLSIAGSVAYAFSTYFIIIIGAGHLWKVNALAFIPPALGGILMVLRGRYLWGGIIATFFLIMELYSNHIQMTYYFMLTVICVLIYEFYHQFKEKNLKHFFKAIGVLAIASIIALGVNFTNLYSSYEYSKSTIRGKSELSLGNKDNQTTGVDKDYGTMWSYGIQETLSLLIPNVKGGGGSPQEGIQVLNYVNGGQVKSVADYYNMEQVKNHHYWGNQLFTVGPVYVGAFVLFLFFLGLFIVAGRLKWGLLTATILAIMLSWGHNFPALSNLFFDYIPLYNKFRAVSSILIIVELCIPLLAILALKKLIDEPEVLKKKVKFASLNLNVLVLPFALTGGIALLLYLIPTFGLDFLSDVEQNYFTQISASNPNAVSFIAQIQNDLVNARIDMFKADALRSFLFILVGAALVWAYSKDYLKAKFFIPAVVVLILVDLYPVNKRFTTNDAFVEKKELKLAYMPNMADFQILQNELKNNPELKAIADQAVKNYTRKNRKASDYEKVAAQLWAVTYNTNYRVFEQIGGPFQNARPSYFHKSIGGYHGAKLRRVQELYEYHIDKGNMKALDMLNAKYIISQGEKGAQLSINPNALGNAWLVDSYKLVKDANEEIMLLNGFNPAKEAIVDQRFENQLNNFNIVADSTANIQMTKYSPNQIGYQYQAKTEQLAVFSEVYYQPGWNAYIDGKPAKHFRANYVLRAMKLPAGKHKVEFKFEPKGYFVGEKISLTSMILFFVVALGAIVFGIKNYKKENV